MSEDAGRMLLGLADVQTIDAFVQGILKRFYDVKCFDIMNLKNTIKECAVGENQEKDIVGAIYVNKLLDNIWRSDDYQIDVKHIPAECRSQRTTEKCREVFEWATRVWELLVTDNENHPMPIGTASVYLLLTKLRENFRVIRLHDLYMIDECQVSQKLSYSKGIHITTFLVRT